MIAAFFFILLSFRDFFCILEGESGRESEIDLYAVLLPKWPRWLRADPGQTISLELHPSLQHGWQGRLPLPSQVH